MQTLLELKRVKAGYGAVQVLYDASFLLARGEAVAIVGRNGMGKTTIVNAIMGICPPSAGEILLKEAHIERQPSHKIARMGIGLVPEGRRIFKNLTVRENLIVAARKSRGLEEWTLQRVLKTFPRLAERLAHMGNQLSGGEQQMLAIGRALLTNPEILILDEATEGLAPLIRNEIWSTLGVLRAEGLSMVLIDKDVEALSRLAERIYVVEKGSIAWSGASRDFVEAPHLQHKYLGTG